MGQRGDMNYTQFEKDVERGKIGEQIFIDDFLKFLNVKYEDVTGKQGYQIVDSDYLSKIGLYEIKATYRDGEFLIIEEYTNCNTKLGNISYGWFYKSKADMFVFVSKASRAMILLPFTDNFKNHYESIKENYPLIKNKVSVKGANKWQSAFRKIPLEAINGYFAYYKRA